MRHSALLGIRRILPFDIGSPPIKSTWMIFRLESKGYAATIRLNKRQRRSLFRNLYEVTFKLFLKGKTVDSRTEYIGIRVLEVEPVFEPGDAGKFLIKANGVPIMAKGSNWVPLDAMHSRDKERLQQAHDLLEELDCNIVRCWAATFTKIISSTILRPAGHDGLAGLCYGMRDIPAERTVCRYDPQRSSQRDQEIAKSPFHSTVGGR